MSEPSSRRAIRGWYASEPYHSLIFWRFGNQHRPGAFFTDQQLDHPLAVRALRASLAVFTAGDSISVLEMQLKQLVTFPAPI